MNESESEARLYEEVNDYVMDLYNDTLARIRSSRCPPMERLAAESELKMWRDQALANWQFLQELAGKIKELINPDA
jgi:hypothetical protein